MRVLIYAHFFAPSVGGVETYARLLADGLTKRSSPDGTNKMEITVVTHTPAQMNYDAEFPFRAVRQPGWFDLLKLIRDADVVQLAGPSLLPMFLALVLGKPIVIEQHGYQAACPNGLLLYEPTKEVCPGHFMARSYSKCLACNQKSLGWRKSLGVLLLTFPRRWLCRHVGTNIAITSHVARRLDLPKTRVVYYGIPDLLPADSVHRTKAIPGTPEPIYFAYVGRLVSEKGLPLLLQATRRLLDQGYDFRVILVGDGPERENLEAEAISLRLQKQLIFTGFLSGESLEDTLRNVAAVVMPSIWEETAGLAAIEQMFRGRPVIVSDIGGLGEVVGSTGLKFPIGDVEALANCMRQVLNKPSIVSQLGQKARLRALDCFDLERMLRDHVAIYDQLCGAQRSGARRD